MTQPDFEISSALKNDIEKWLRTQIMNRAMRNAYEIPPSMTDAQMHEAIRCGEYPKE